MPIVAGLASSSSEEQLSDITYSLRRSGEDTFELNAIAKSSLWTGRRFLWRFFPDHIEFQQFATGSGNLGRCYFLAAGVSNRWDNGTTSGYACDATIYADRYFAQISSDEQHDFIDMMRQNKLQNWQGPSGSLVYLVLRSDAIDVVYGTVEGYEALGIPYMPHIAPVERW